MDNAHLWANAYPVTLEDILAARDERSSLQKELLNQYGKTLLCFTMNIPGPHKVYPLVEKGFLAGIKALGAQLSAEGILTVMDRQQIASTGCTYWSVLDAPASAVKRLAMAVEENHPLGRLFDMDVLSPSDGLSLSGQDYGRGERTCLICGKPVWACSRSRAHTADELSQYVAHMLLQYDYGCFSQQTGLLATRALLYEVAVTPKPGLVDRHNNGSHHDMNFFTFLDSGTALTPYFQEMTKQGLFHSGTPSTLLDTLRYAGRQAEGEMFSATRQINTHKGLIFSLGLLCACAGYRYAQKLPLTTDGLLELAAQSTAGLTDELKMPGTSSSTHGRRAYHQYRAAGIRGEAAAGYPHVRQWGLPVLRDMAEAGCSLNDAGVIALLHLMAHLEDTNIIARSDRDSLLEMQERILGELSRTQDPAQLISFAQALDQWMIERKMSPGGSADLLAISYFLFFLI